MRRLLAAFLAALVCVGQPASAQLLTLGVSGNDGTATPTYAGAVWDDFSRTGNLGGSTVTSGTYTWAYLSGNTGNTTALSTSVNGAGVGQLSGGAGASPNNMYAAITVPVTNSKWVVRWTNPNATLDSGVKAADNITYVPTGTWDREMLRLTAAGSAALTYSYAKALAGSSTGTTLSSATFTWGLAGDTIESRYYPSGGNTLVDIYQNGMMINQGGNVTSTAVAFNGVYGAAGNLGTNAWRYMEVGDPDTQAMLHVTAPNHVQATDSNGDMTIGLQGSYSQATLTSVTYTLYNSSTDAVVTGTSNQPVANFSASGGSYSGRMAKVVAANIPASFYYKTCRADITGGGSMCSRSPVIKPGGVYGFSGQSLNTLQMTAGAAVNSTATQSAWGWLMDGSTCAGACVRTSDVQRRVTLATANTPNAEFFAQMIAGGASANIEMVRGGEGATTTNQRGPGYPGSTTYSSYLAGIQLAGGALTAALENGGTYDAQNNVTGGGVADYTNNVNAIYNQLESDLGMAANSLPVQMVILGAVTANASDANQEAIRVQQIQLAASGGRYFRGPDTYDLQHLTNDPYHLTNDGFFEQARREGLAFLDKQFGGTTFKRGPTLSSVTLISDHQVDATYACPNCTAITINNATNGGQNPQDQAQTFATSAANYLAATFVHVNATPTCDAPSGGNVVCHFVFPSGTFGAHAYVGGPYGINPGNPNNSSTIENNGAASSQAIATGKAMLLGTYSGETSVAVRTYYDTANSIPYMVTP